MSILKVDTLQPATASAIHNAGSVVQVVGTKFDGNSANVIATTSTSFTDTGLSVTITPKFNTSKILVTICCQVYTSSNAHGDIAIYRGSTEIIRSSMNWNSSGGGASQGSLQILDAPATTSATEYSMYIRSANSSQTTTHNGSSTSDSHITLMEIAQ